MLPLHGCNSIVIAASFVEAIKLNGTADQSPDVHNSHAKRTIPLSGMVLLMVGVPAQLGNVYLKEAMALASSSLTSKTV
jgi:hypothetical protein